MTTKIIHLYRGAQDGLRLYTTEEIEEGKTFWVPSPQLQELLSGKNFPEIRDMLDDPENERYLDDENHLISYLMEEELESDEGHPVYRYGECPAETQARIAARQQHDQEHQ